MLPLSTFIVLSGNPLKGSIDTVVSGVKSKFLASVVENTGMTGDFVQAAENSINSVVHVTTKVVTTNFQRDLFSEMFYGPGAGGKEFKQYGAGSGSGVIVSADGYIVTNNHVIENASEIEVILNDNSKYKAKLIATDPSTDIAVLKIEGKNLQPIVIGNSDNVKVGEWVLAVGNPFNLTSTVTAGIVSAKARNINLLSDRSKSDIIPIESFIQTDAAVNPGNSGGALVNIRGELIGINTAIQSQTGSYAGYAFAIPVNLVTKVLNDLIDFGIVQRAFLGVQISDITQEIKEKNNLPNLKGVFLSKINEGGSADKAGINDGDVILKIGTQEVNSVASLQEEVGKRRPGDKISITIRNKNNEELVKELILRNSDGETKLVTKTEIQKNMALGATFIEATDKEKKELSIKNGIKIKTLNAGKLKSQGLTEGMIITKVNNEVIQTIEQLTNKLNQGSSVVWLEVISSTGEKLFVGFEI
jgi:Do/DeqQ family serine protease